MIVSTTTLVFHSAGCLEYSLVLSPTPTKKIPILVAAADSMLNRKNIHFVPQQTQTGEMAAEKQIVK